MLFPYYIQTNCYKSILEQIYGDWLLATYFEKLDEEIADDIPEFAEYKELVTQILDATREYGFCMVQPYADEIRVFTPLQWVEWITEPAADGKQQMVGAKIHWVDAFKNQWDDDLYFDNRITTEVEQREYDENTTETITTASPSNYSTAYLFIWKKGNGVPKANSPMLTNFALPDLTTAILSLAIQIRQIQGALAAGATEPYFYHFKYGDSITASQRTTLTSQMGYVGHSKGIGAKESVLAEIIPVENSSVEKTTVALLQLLEFFAGATRLPLSYYMGEKQIGSGLDSGGAEQTDMVLVMKKKEFILQHFLEPLSRLFSEQLGITLPDLSKFYTEKAEAEKQAQQDREDKLAMKSNGVESNG